MYFLRVVLGSNCFSMIADYRANTLFPHFLFTVHLGSHQYAHIHMRTHTHKYSLRNEEDDDDKCHAPEKRLIEIFIDSFSLSLAIIGSCSASESQSVGLCVRAKPHFYILFLSPL